MDTSPSPHFKQRLAKIEAFVFDNDGVFTNGTVYLMPGGEQVRTASTRDGYAVQHAAKCGVKMAMITGGKSDEVIRRMNGLGVTEVITGAAIKITELEDLCARWGISLDQVCYMGDDIPDIPVLKASGLACCPHDAVPEVRAVCDYISPINGGYGCVRDILEQAMKVKGLWMNELAHAW